TGVVVDKFAPPSAPPEIWVLWHGSNLPVPELPSTLKFGKKISRGLKPELDKHNCSDNFTEEIQSELNGEELTTVPWNDQFDWSNDEPLDPDDVWIIGEKVCWKRCKRDGVVVGVLQEPILGGQLNYVVVRWTDTKQTLPIEPENLWRLRGSATSEFNPLEPESESSSSGLNQVEQFNPLEPESDLSSSGLNQVKRRGARGKQIASGYMYAYTKNKKLKSGITATFPRVEGHRDPNNIAHWYWNYTYQEKVDGDWKNRTLFVPQFRVTTVRFMIGDGMPVAAIKALIKGEFAKD
ncbi:MAG: hypothetical protein WBB28_21825, partial [Crinalium sp.]